MPAATATPQALDFPLPLRGVHKHSAWHQLPPGFAHDAANVLTYDAGGRARIGVRPGLSKYWSFDFQDGGSTDPVRCLEQATVDVSGTRTDYIIVVCGGRTYRMTPSDVAVQRIDGGAAAFSAARRCECATYANVTYFTDGLAVKMYDHATGAWDNWTHNAGAFPSAGGRYPRILAVWRGRMVLGLIDSASEAHVVYFSEQNNPRGFDYGAAHSATMAVATNVNFRAGQIGNPITALIPVNEDVLVVGTDRGLFKFTGDPADGGTLVPISETIGVLTPDSWGYGPGGEIYFIGTEGFYKFSPFGGLEKLSDEAFDTNFAGLPNTGYSINCAFDRTLMGVWITAVKSSAFASVTKNCFYDLRAKAFWPVTWTTADQNPLRVLCYDGSDTSTQDRVILLGGNDGYVRKINPAVLADDSVAISSYVWLGPLQPMGGATQEAMLNGMHVIMGEGSNFGATVELYSGADPYAAQNAAATKTTTVTASGRQSVLGWRQADNAFWVKVSNSNSAKTFRLERVAGIFEAGGPNR